MENAKNKHVVALSGGKDSTAMALWLADNRPQDYVYVCTPTGDELPEMEAHWSKLEAMLSVKIIRVTPGYGLLGLIAHERMLPNNRARFCTRKLKIEPYYAWLSEQKCPIVSYVGLRADEGLREGMIFPETSNVEMRFPLRDLGWRIADVINYLEIRGVKIPARTDCALCYHQTLGEWWRLWKLHPERYNKGVLAEKIISERRGKKHTFRNDSRDTWPAPLEELAAEFETGRIPPNTVRQIDFFSGEGRRPTMCRACSL